MIILFWLPVLGQVLAQTPIDDADKFNQYLLLGYAVMWLVAFVYLLNLANKQRNLRQEIQLMRRIVDDNTVLEPTSPASFPEEDARLEENEAGAAT